MQKVQNRQVCPEFRQVLDLFDKNRQLDPSIDQFWVIKSLIFVYAILSNIFPP